MKKLLVILLCASCTSIGAPFLVSDPEPDGPVACVYQIGTAAPVSTPTVLNACNIDLAAFPAGKSDLQVWFSYGPFGDSAKVAFSLTKPAGRGPVNIRIK